MEDFLKAIFYKWPSKLKQVAILTIALFGAINWPLRYKLLLFLVIIILDIIWDYCQEIACSKKILDNFCQNLYYSLFIRGPSFRDFRVSILIARRFLGIGFRILEVRGRFFQGEGKESSMIYFRKGQGVAGISFSTNQIYKEDTLPDPRTQKAEYIKVSKEKYKLSWWQTKFLHRLARTYICFPIEYFDQKGKVAAVLSIDSDKPYIFSRKKFNQKKKILERELKNFKVVFSKKG